MSSGIDPRPKVSQYSIFIELKSEWTGAIKYDLRWGFFSKEKQKKIFDCILYIQYVVPHTGTFWV